MNIEKIKIFLTVVEEGSLYAAAKKLDYTTMDIHAAIKLVENELGVSMFNQLEVNNKNADVVILSTKPEVKLKIGIMHPDWNEMSLSARTLFEELKNRNRKITVSEAFKP